MIDLIFRSFLSVFEHLVVVQCSYFKVPQAQAVVVSDWMIPDEL